MAKAAGVDPTATILLVEDERLVRELAQYVLEVAGHRVVSARTGDEALRLARSAPDGVDLLISDVSMPGMSGQDLATALRDQFPELRVLLISGYIPPETETLSDVHFLGKPFTPDQLAARVTQILTSPSRRPTNSR
jgi:CheY-like chemotaxis protein